MAKIVPPRRDASLGAGPSYGLVEERPRKHWLPPVSGLSRSASVPGSPSPGLLQKGSSSASASAPSSRSGARRGAPAPGAPAPGGGVRWRREMEGILMDMKALEGGAGRKGSTLLRSLQAGATRERVELALEEGEPRELRKAVRFATTRLQMDADPLVQRARAALATVEHSARECRDGLAQGDLARLQRAVGAVAQSGLGPRVFEDPCLAQARDRLATWTPYAPYLRRLDEASKEGPDIFAACWVEAVEAQLLSPEWEEAAAAQLARCPGAEEALEEALQRPEVRLQYGAPWQDRNRLLAMVQARLSELGFDILSLCVRAARAVGAEGSSGAGGADGAHGAGAGAGAGAGDDGLGQAPPDASPANAGEGAGEGEGAGAAAASSSAAAASTGGGAAAGDAIGAAVVVSGPGDLIAALEQTFLESGEPAAMGHRPSLEAPEQRTSRFDALRARFAAAAEAPHSSASCMSGAFGASRPWFASCPVVEPPVSLLDPRCDRAAGLVAPSAGHAPSGAGAGGPGARRRLLR